MAPSDKSSGSDPAPLHPRRTFGEKMERNITRLPRRTWDSVRRLGKSLWKLPHKLLVRKYWMKLGDLAHYPPRKMVPETFPTAEVIASTAGAGIAVPQDADLPSIAIVTPSFQQADFIRETLESVLWQRYPDLCYVVQDGGSNDGTRAILEDYGPRLHYWASEKDSGQADAIRRGFEKAEGDIMAWLNSDDTLLPGALHFVGRYFATHPDVDVIYGHRILIDERSAEIGRWILPPHRDDSLAYVDYVPQETLFWRRSIYEKVGGLDPSFRFAMDWDLLMRFIRGKARIVRVPYFLGCFRVHKHQKTSAQISSTGVQEMERIRREYHGRDVLRDEINNAAHKLQISAVITARMLAMGIRR
jgi:hypothetical protein